MSFEQDDLLSTNQFIRPLDIEELEDTEIVDFREYYESKKRKENSDELHKRLREHQKVDVDEIIDINDLTGTNPFKINEKKPEMDQKKTIRIKKERKTIVSVDSRDRDKEIYPKVNNFKTFLGKTYKNVKSIKLLSTEFPNTEGVIKSDINNKVYWVNEEDVDLGFPIYSITVRPGSYTATSLTDELTEKFGLVKRRNGEGQFHYFDIKIDLDTDIVTFRSFIIKDLNNNPVSTSAGTGIITITSPNHGFKNEELVEIIGVKRTAGIPSTTLNGSFNITFINTSQFSYEVNINAIDSVAGGGNVVKTGKQAPMQLLWDDFTDTVGPPNLGYPEENSSEKLNTSLSNPFLTKTLQITDVELGDPVVITSPNHGLLTSTNLQITAINIGTQAEIITSVNHLLKTGDKVYLADTDCVPVIDIDAKFTVTVTDSNKFTIPFEVTSAGSTGIVKIGGEKVMIKNLILLPPLIESNTNEIFLAETNSSDPINKFNIDTYATGITAASIPNSYIGTSQLTVTHENHGFNKIVSAENNGAGKVKVTTQLKHGLKGTVLSISSIVASVTLNVVEITSNNHGLLTGDSVTISDSDSVPIIDGRYFITREDANTISISLVGSVTTPGTTGTIKNGSSMTISESDSVPSIDGSYSRVEYVSDTEVNIFNNNPNDVFPTGLSVNATTGIVGVSNNVTFYRTKGETDENTEMANIKFSAINNYDFLLDEIIDENTYLIRVEDNYATSTLSDGGNEVRVHSEKHGMDFKQTNTTDGEVLNKSVSLEGENYVFLISPTLETVTSSSGLSGIFAKILLSEPPNTLMFNTFLSNSKIFEETPLATLNELFFQVKNNDGTFYNFNDIDYSFSLEIIEYVDILENTGFSSRRGMIDFSSKEGEQNMAKDSFEEDKDKRVTSKAINRLE